MTNLMPPRGFLAALAICALSSGCVTHNWSKGGDPVNVVQYVNVKAGLEVGQPVEAKVEVSKILGFIVLGMPQDFADGVSYTVGASAPGGLLAGLLGGGGTAEAAKSAAAYMALKGGEYDVLLGARYHVHTEDYMIFTKYTVTVKGTGAKITGFTPE